MPTATRQIFAYSGVLCAAAKLSPGSLLGGAGSSPGRALNLHLPLAVAAVGYLVALGLTWATIRDERR